MRCHERDFSLAGGLIALMFFAGISSEAIAHPKNNKVTICHVVIGGNGHHDDDEIRSKTLRLPAHVAQRHLELHPNDFTGECGGTKFLLLAVSGTLEEGFPLRPNLDFITEVNEGNPAVLGIFLGHALVRGVKAFLDMKDPNSREFVAGPPGLNPVNPGLVDSGNDNDANISSLYFIDRRQAARALAREPRLLSITPDNAKMDINAAETDDSVRKFVLQAIQEDTTILGPKNMSQVTLMQVISVWKSCHFVPSPIRYTKPDGTRVTDFPNSLALFAGTAAPIASPQYFADVDVKVRQTLNLPASEPGSKDCIDNPSTFPIPPLPGGADPLTSYGVDKHTKRMNDILRPCQLDELLARAGVNISVPQCPN